MALRLTEAPPRRRHKVQPARSKLRSGPASAARHPQGHRPELGKSAARRSDEEAGLALFFRIGEPLEKSAKRQVAMALETCGFELLETMDLDAARISAASGALGRNNLPKHALATMFIGFDLMPIPPSPDLLERRPSLDNGRIMEAEAEGRKIARNGLCPGPASEALRSTDNSSQAWELIRLMVPDREAQLRSAVARRKAEFATRFEVVRDLTRRGRRSKVELIRYGGGLAVKKTFRHQCLRYFEREASFLETVSTQRSEILPVLERGENYLITPFVEAQPRRARFLGRGYPKLMKLGQVRATADLLRFLFSRGYDPVDMSPHNLLVDATGRLTAIDFEFLHKSDEPIDPEHSICLGGLKEGFQGDWPREGGWWLSDPYRLRWFAHTGLTRRSFLHGPLWFQRIERAVNYPAFLATKALTHVARRLLRGFQRHPRHKERLRRKAHQEP